MVCGFTAHLLFGLPGTHGGATAPSRGSARGTHGGVRPVGRGQVGSSVLTVPGARQSPSHLGTVLVAWAVADRLTGGGQVAITALLTHDGTAVRGSELSLFEWVASQRHWQRLTVARTGRHGTAILRVPSLTTNARFLVTDAARDVSQPVTIVMIPSVSLSLAKHGKRAGLLVRCLFAARGDMLRLQVRQRRPGGGWQTAGNARLAKNGTAC